jgi:hypothetical protein
MPGTYPAFAFDRKQMRHRPNFRRTLLARPQTWQRRTVRVMNFGFLAALILIALLAISSGLLAGRERHSEAL